MSILLESYPVWCCIWGRRGPHQLLGGTWHLGVMCTKLLAIIFTWVRVCVCACIHVHCACAHNTHISVRVCASASQVTSAQKLRRIGSIKCTRSTGLSGAVYKTPSDMFGPELLLQLQLCTLRNPKSFLLCISPLCHESLQLYPCIPNFVFRPGPFL